MLSRPAPDVPSCGPWLLAAGVDWLTTTSADPVVAHRLRQIAGRALRSEVDSGNTLSAWQWNGYRGYTAGQVAAGARQDGTIVRLSGQASYVWWHAAWQAGGRPSRIDLAVTVAGVPAGVDLATIHEGQALRSPHVNGRPPRVQLLREQRRGQTLYLGSRHSDLLCRVYDKQAEQPGQYAAGSWRYELQYSRRYAPAAAATLAAQPDCPAAVVSIVHTALRRRGLAPVFDNAAEPLAVTPPRHVTDDERRLEWLRNQVAPSIGRLILRGYGAEIRHLLAETWPGVTATGGSTPRSGER